MVQAEKALILGSIPDNYFARDKITSDFALVEKKLGITLENVPYDVLAEKLDALNDAELSESRAMARVLWDRAGKGIVLVPNREDVEQVARQALAMRDVVMTFGATALTVNCFSVPKSIPIHLPCIALGWLQDWGIVANCQVDIDAFLTMILIHRVTDSPSFMAGMHDDKNNLIVSHCAIPLNMLRPAVSPVGAAYAPDEPYTLGIRHNKGSSPTVRTTLPPGTPVTIARFTYNLEHFLIGEGYLLESGAELGTTSCCNTFIIKTGRLDIFRANIKGVQNHLAIVTGSYADALTQLVSKLNISVVR